MVWVMGRDGVATYANRRFRDYYGGLLPERAERVARNHPDDAERMARAWSEAHAAGRPFEVEGRLRRHDGIYRWHKLVMLPIRGGDGGVAEWIGTALDIDDIIGAREQLKETTDLLRLAQEAAGAGTWEWNLATGLTRLCPESARMHGLPADGFAEVSLEGWRARVHPDDVGATSEAMRRAVGTGGVYSAEFRILPEAAAPAAERWIHAMGRVVCDWDGRPVRMVGLNLDVTERKRAEAALNEAKAAAEAASEAKTDFLASMSHEIRTPLNGVLGYADLLLDDRSLSPDQRRHAERIRSAGNALLVVVDDILDFSKIEAGQVALEHQPFAPASLIDNAVSIVRGLAERKGLRLDVDADPGLPPHLLGDQDRLRQILLNLLNNAVKFTPHGSVTLTVRVEGEPGSARRIRFAVTDTGIGIPEAKRSRLFQRFSQVDGSIQREFGGTGLGLAISRRLVELMGGEIGVASELGRGSTFWFHVSLEPAAAGGAAGCGAVAAPAGGGRRARILLVEDMPVNGRCSRRLATRWTWRGTGRRRSRPCSPTPTTCASWTSRCPAWTASRRPATSGPSVPIRRAACPSWP
jgi:PAS domain S-box-containing protein